MTTKIINPRIYTIDSFYYYFTWEWQVINDNNEVVNDIEPDIDLNKEYEVKIYINDGSVYIPCNSNNLLIVKYNQPISVLTIENVCQGSNFTIPENCTKCKFVIREKKEGVSDEWSAFFPSTDFCLMPLPLNTMKLDENLEKNTVTIGVDNNLRNFLNESNNPFVQYYAYFVNNGNNISPSKNCFYQPKGIMNSYFVFNTYYNSMLKLNTLYNIDTVYYRYNQVEMPSFDNQLSNYTTNIIPQQQYTLNYSSNIYNVDTPNKQGALIYVIDGEGWKVNNTSLEKEHTYNFLSNEYETLIFTSAGNNTSNLKINMYGHSIETNIDYNRYIQFTTGNKYAQQIEAFDDLKTIQPTSNISNNEFTYSYNSTNNHTPVFIYQKMQNNTYNLTNNSSNLNTGFLDIITNDLIVTTSPVMDYEYGSYSLNHNSFTRVDVQNYNKFIVSNIKFGSGLPTDHTSGVIKIAYDEDSSFEDSEIIYNSTVINTENHNYVWLKFISDTAGGSATIKYFLDDSNNDLGLKTTGITEEELNQYTEKHKNMLSVNQVFNSLEQNFEWVEPLKIDNYKGEPALYLKGTLAASNMTNEYDYKVCIYNQMSNKEFLQEELDLINNNGNWVISNNGTNYDNENNPYLLSSLKNKELSSKEKYHIIVKRIFGNNEKILDEFDLNYQNNYDFFTAPVNNLEDEVNILEINKDFYFTTERNNKDNAEQGYPCAVYNNDDNVAYFCYSNEAQNNLGSESVYFYDKTFSDNKQLIHINYHDKPNFTSKEVIPMLDFKITELVEQNFVDSNCPAISFTNNVSVTDNYHNNQRNIQVEANGDNAHFILDLQSYTQNNFISFNPISSGVSGAIKIIDTGTGKEIYTNNNTGCYAINDINNKKIANSNNLLFELSNDGFINLYNLKIKTLVQPDNSDNALLQNRKFYLDNFSINEIDYSQIENGSIISGQVLELHKPITLHIENFTTNMSSNKSIYYKIEKINEYNQEVITPIDDDNSITILQEDDNDNTFTKDFYINSYTNQLKIQNTKTKQITFNNAQKDTIVNCILEKEEVED